MLSYKYFFLKKKNKIASSKNSFSKLLSQKKTFSKLLSQKIYFQNCSLKIACLNYTFLKLLPQKIHPQNCSLKKYFFNKYIFKTTFSKKYVFKIAPTRIHFPNYSLKNINLIVLIYSSSESLEEFSMLSIICLITFFQCTNTLLKSLANNSFQLY